MTPAIRDSYLSTYNQIIEGLKALVLDVTMPDVDPKEKVENLKRIVQVLENTKHDLHVWVNKAYELESKND